MTSYSRLTNLAVATLATLVFTAAAALAATAFVEVGSTSTSPFVRLLIDTLAESAQYMQ